MTRSTLPPLDEGRLNAEGLFLSVGSDLVLQMGTCGHCAVLEKGRPVRASEPQGPDFPQDRFLELMATMGVTLDILEEYYCP